jgi:hypothetical protein
MAIIKDNTHLSNALEKMLQGLAFWMGYSRCVNILYEHDCVHEAFAILRAQLDKSKYILEYEYNYSDIDSTITTKERADLVILKKTAKKMVPICVLEFKMSTNTNGGVEADVEKLRNIKKKILKYVILLINEDNPALVWQFASGKMNSYTAKRKALLRDGTTVRVRRVAKAMATADNPKRNPYMSICIEP